MVKPTRVLHTDARRVDDSSERSNGADVTRTAVQTDRHIGESARTSLASARSSVRCGKLELWTGGHANVRLDLSCQLEANSKAAHYRGKIIGFDERNNGRDIGHVEAVVTGTFGLCPKDVIEEEFWPLYSQSGRLVRAADALVEEGSDIFPGAFFLTDLALISEVRGHGLGHHVMERLLQILAINCGYAVLSVAPRRESTLKQTSDTSTIALVNYWQKIDFVRVEAWTLWSEISRCNRPSGSGCPTAAEEMPSCCWRVPQQPRPTARDVQSPAGCSSTLVHIACKHA